MRIELRDSLENVFFDSVIAARPCRRLALDVARNGTAAVHILLNDLPAGSRFNVAVRKKGRVVRKAQWFQLLDVPVEENTGLVGFTTRTRTLNVFPHTGKRNAPNPHVIRKAPFRTFDIMQPVRGGAVRSEAATTALRLHLPIAASAKPGVHEFTIAISSGQITQNLVVQVRVHGVVIPPADRSALPYTNWFGFSHIAKHHGLKLWSGPYWRMLRKYADLMQRGRQNCVLVYNNDLFEMTPQGPVLDRQRLRRIVKIFTDAGIYYIEGSWVAGRKEWTSPTFEAALSMKPATTPEGYATIEAICRQLGEEIAANGWKDRWLQHVADEPLPLNASDYRILCGIVRKLMPGILIMDAIQDPTLVGSVDMWCPQVQEYERDREAYEATRAQGDKVWCYTCCFPGGPWLNRLLDQELLRPALIGWGVALYKLDGFLHWGLNWWEGDCRKLTSPARPAEKPKANRLPPGDTHMIYPGAAGPLSGLRFEAHREGFEDHALLRRLQKENPRAAAAVLRKVIRGFSDYTKDVQRFRAGRKMLLEALS
ncbi:MAG: DUF4091 domain-containing protein [bacterium]